jgi:arrestin-related trafficking adapter 9
VISLEPIAKRGRVRVKVRHASLEKTKDATSRTQFSRTNTDSSTHSNRPISQIQPPQSPVPSEHTTVSRNSTSTNSFQVVNHTDSAYAPSRKDSEAQSSTTSASSQTITATTELEKQGALPGDTIPIRVSVIHNKPNVRGLVIATLYRQGRIDLHPAIPLVSRGRTRRAECEDIYPRSKSGLGGLHFSHGSASSVFRKDLSQSTAMMIVNPQTMTADVKTSIKLPDNAFPTMSNVPGGMITFKYYVEVVIDLCGKLGETRFLPRLTSMEPSFTDGAENINQSNSDWANNILDTLQLRRTKSVVDFTFAVIVGTKDSGRIPNSRAREDNTMHEGSGTEYHPDEMGYLGDEDYYDASVNYDGDWDGSNEYEDFGQALAHDQNQNEPSVQVMPPPPPEEPVDEKERLKRQEALLLPSQPPEEGGPSRAAEASAPSAPYIPQDTGSYDYCGLVNGEAGPSVRQVRHSAMSTRSVDTIVDGAAAGTSDPLTFDVDTSRRLQDDKQDLERQRLMAQASAPPEDDNDLGDRPQFSANDHMPTAPVLGEADEYNAYTINREHTSGEPLPQYRR